MTNKSSCYLLISLCLLLLSVSLIQCKPNSNCNLPRFLQSEEETDNEENSDSDSGTGSSSQGCWLQSYGRGVGVPISTCPAGQENDDSLCYTPCQSGYTGAGPVCWQQCPSGFTDTGADCLKPGSYGRGTGYTSKSKCEDKNSQGCEKNGLLYYPKCAANFHAVGCCVCSPNCPSGMTDIGVSCQKQSYGRGVGTPLVCTSSQQEDAGLCYNQCKAGYDGIGPVCWGQCPSGMFKCGALCLQSESDCVGTMLEIADEVAEAFSEDGEDDDDDAALSYTETGINVGQQLASYPICSNM